MDGWWCCCRNNRRWSLIFSLHWWLLVCRLSLVNSRVHGRRLIVDDRWRRNIWRGYMRIRQGNARRRKILARSRFLWPTI